MDTNNHTAWAHVCSRTDAGHDHLHGEPGHGRRARPPSYPGLPRCWCVLPRTLDCPTAQAHRQALQSFLDDLTPWISLGDLPLLVSIEGYCTGCLARGNDPQPTGTRPWGRNLACRPV